MKLSDFIVEFIIGKGITDVFGYPGGMVTHLMDSFDKYRGEISAHVNYNEQGSSFAACGYAQVSGKPGVAFATSGPGATNLVTGIANAYFDSIPTIFITGQVNTYESKCAFKVRQKGFQETDIVSMVQGITKFSVVINKPEDVLYYLEKAYIEATTGRPGPVVLDIPMNVQRADINPTLLRIFNSSIHNPTIYPLIAEEILEAIFSAKRPCIIVGAGVQQNSAGKDFSVLTEQLKIPVVSSMLAVDILPDSDYYYGFLGAYGDRTANFIIAKSDLIISIGSRLDIRQTGVNLSEFAPCAKLIRIDIDANELTNKIKDDEIQYLADLKPLIKALITQTNSAAVLGCEGWIFVCNELKSKLMKIDTQPINSIIEKISSFIEKGSIITTDVGQNQVWLAQSFKPNGQRILFSGGHGAMGYSLPAAIGAYYGSRKKVYSFNGDGGIQMNIQELQFIVREKLPIKIIVINNQALGMIRHFQEMYFDSNYMQTKKEKGYLTPNFSAIANAYGIPALKTDGDFSQLPNFLSQDGPALIEIMIKNDTYVFPKLAMGKPNEDQEPPLDRTLYEYLSQL